MEQIVEIKDKPLLTVEEASRYFNIGMNTLQKLLKSPKCSYVLYIGSKKLVKRKEFEKVISESIEL